MKETEVKIIDINKEDVIARLESLGAKKIFEGILDGINFDFDDRRIVSKKDLLRLRREGDKVVLCFKKSLVEVGFKQTKETEIEVSDFDACLKILESLGLKQLWRLVKYRTSYVLDNLRVEIEELKGEYEGVPPYIELESDDNPEALFAFVQKLGFKKSDCKAWTARDVLKHYGRLSTTSFK